MLDGEFPPQDDDIRLRARPQLRHSAWAKAKLRLLEYWDYPPAALFWLILTAGTIAALKIAGL
ncbi:hypothetical protein [Rhodovibrio salinarum]|uniref:Uncharacterized protein n=1 Tax=Rhodovibrio salinarum TaxID=1087 RepID=A0A934QHI4_9PROT|nr:hypothetical protein [Rhodovibrio salinarum]MBK1696650.1 hypothetical protein [Rhodovibrio salinarum]